MHAALHTWHSHAGVEEPSTHQKLPQIMIAIGGLRGVFYMAPLSHFLPNSTPH